MLSRWHFGDMQKDPACTAGCSNSSGLESQFAAELFQLLLVPRASGGLSSQSGQLLWNLDHYLGCWDISTDRR